MRDLPNDSIKADLVIQNLGVKYGGVTALHDVSFKLAAGQTLMVTGPNGAGKSTLMKSLMGWVRPHQGSLQWRGQNVMGKSPEAIASLGISLVPEGRQVFGSLSVLENLKVASGLRLQRGEKQAVKADLDALLEVFDMLKPRLHTQAGMLSGGQQQMLVIARGLMLAPQLLCIDEPSLGLAPQVTDQVYAALLRWQAERHLSVLIVEQSTARAQQVGCPLVMVREGRIVLQGRASDFSAEQLEQAYFGYAPQQSTQAKHEVAA